MPAEKSRVIRILLMPPVFALLTFGCLFVKYNAAYLLAVNMLYEAVALTSLFILLCCYVDNNEQDRALFFLNLPAANSGTYRGSFPWYSVSSHPRTRCPPYRYAKLTDMVETLQNGLPIRPRETGRHHHNDHHPSHWSLL
jgi:hypothetical protein